MHWPFVAVIVGAKLIFHLALGGRYGYFRDELYFLDLGRHLDWGYVDTAPLIGVYAKVALLLGGSLHALRLMPAVAGATTVLLCMLIARELGGRRFGQALAGICALVAPVWLMGNSIMTMNSMEPVFWMGCVLVMLRFLWTRDSRLWIWFGVLAGLGLQNKHSTLFFGFAVFVALAATEWRELTKPWIWLGGALALLIFLPNLIWQFQHGFPTLEDLENVRRSGKNVELGPLAFVGQQILMMHPATFPVWMAGLVSLTMGGLRRFRILGVTFLTFFTVMLLMKGKNYYVAPIYPMMLAAGAVAFEKLLRERVAERFRLLPQVATVVLLLTAGAALVPAITPLLPPEGMAAYARRLGVTSQRAEKHHDGPLPQVYGDQFGWEEMTQEVARGYHALPPEERARTGIRASNYGEAGAINLFGPKYGLPPAISAHQNHFFWGPPKEDPTNLIVLQWDQEDVEESCASWQKIADHYHPFGMGEENRPIYLCRGYKGSLRERWPQLKHWN